MMVLQKIKKEKKGEDDVDNIFLTDNSMDIYYMHKKFKCNDCGKMSGFLAENDQLKLYDNLKQKVICPECMLKRVIELVKTARIYGPPFIEFEDPTY